MSEFVSAQIFSTIGWTIIHSLWQGFLISLLLSVILIFTNNKSSRLRSTVSYLALILLFTISLRTYRELNSNYSRNHHSSTSTESLSRQENPSKIEQILANAFPTEKSKSIILECTYLTKNFLSANINLIVLLWFAGIILLSIRLLGGIFYTQRIKSREVIPVNHFWNKQILSLTNKFEITKRVTLLQSKLVDFPITIGYFKPVILLPLELISGIPQSQLKIILAHELAHIKRADYILNIFQSIIEVLFFFNPAVWWISKTIRTEREYLCDDLAIETCGNSTTLAKALLFVQNRNYTQTKIAMAAIGNKHSLMGRIKRMTHSKKENKVFTTALTITSLLLLIAFVACSNLDGEIVKKSKLPTKMSEVEYASTSSSTTESAFASSEKDSKEDASSTIVISSAKNSSRAANAMDDDKGIKLSFHEKNVKWEAYFEDDKLVELFREGKLVPENEFSKHEDFVYRRYDEFTENMAELDIQMDELKIDLSELKNIKINFDSQAFALEMEEMTRELKEGLSELKIFNSEEFAQEMKEVKLELNKELAELKDFDFDIEFDFDELNENLKNIKNIKIDLSGLDKDMASFEIELGELKKELKILKYFLIDLKEGLVDDGYLEDENFKLELTETKMLVNNKRLPNNIHQKYLDLYKEHYCKDLDDGITISD